VPLRILGLGRQPTDPIQADVFLLTDQLPTMLPGFSRELSLTHSAAANKRLSDDLRSDDGMSWVPESAWLTKVSINSTTADLKHDLAVDASGQGVPSRVAAGLESPSQPAPLDSMAPPAAIGAGAMALMAAPAFARARRERKTES
jgi:hypothetical protein